MSGMFTVAADSGTEQQSKIWGCVLTKELRFCMQFKRNVVKISLVIITKCSEVV